MQYKFFDGVIERDINADMFEVEALTSDMVTVSFFGHPYVKTYKHPLTGEDVVADRRDRISAFHVIDGWWVESQQESGVLAQASKIARGAL